MLLHGIALTFVVAAGSWCLAMSLGIVLLVIRLMPQPHRRGGGRGVRLLSPQRADAGAADALVLRHRQPAARRRCRDWLDDHEARRFSRSSRSGSARPPISARTCAPGLRSVASGQTRGGPCPRPQLHRRDAPRADAAGASATRCRRSSTTASRCSRTAASPWRSASPN